MTDNIKHTDKLKHAEPVSFDILYDQFQPLIYGTVKRYAPSAEWEDMLQVARLALWEAYQVYDPARGAFAPLAHRYVRGRVLNALRRQFKQQTIPFSGLTTEDGEGELEWADPHAEQPVDHVVEQELLARMSALLSPREQIILNDHLLNGITLVELAQQHDVSRETVKTWKKRALHKMRSALQSHNSHISSTGHS